ncbi:MAG: OmpA family protein [Desulfosalsimonadaceae bacterium]|nr:OmpA family protein [Desulfosalsimonadaceae bacterium]
MRNISPAGAFGLLMILIFAAALTTACGTIHRTQMDQQAADDPTEAVNKLEKEMAVARQKDFSVLSPDVFAKAEAAYLKAKNDIEQGNPAPDIAENIYTARTHLQTAEQNAKLARTLIPEVIESRRMARIAGAVKMVKEYENIERKFVDLTRGIEYNNISYTKRNAQVVNDAYRKLEMRAIKTEAIGEVRAILKRAEEDEITQFAPESFAQARKMLAETDAFISAHPYAKEEMLKMAKENLFMAHRAISIADQCKGIRNMAPEEIALYVEDTLTLITTKLGAQDMRDQKFYIQVDNIEESIQSLNADNLFMAEKIKAHRDEVETMKADYDRRIADLNRQIAILESGSQVEQTEKETVLAQHQAAEERQAAEREFDQLFTEIRNYFNQNEAEVFKKGNQLVIRLKDMHFPMGQATIMPENYLLLSKVQRAIRNFGEPMLLIKSHTDSTGAPELSKHLSQQRADAVREYLIAGQTLPADKIIALGFGHERPLASNETEAGRAINRRIELILSPAPPADAHP